METKTTDESIGLCDGLCGGLLSHHLIDGLCPQCRADARIKTDQPAESPLGVESAWPESLVDWFNAKRAWQ